MNLPGYLRKDILVLGCGNLLFGDDGFGPEWVRYFLDNYKIPEDVAFIDAGLSVRNILFDIALSPVRPELIIIVDAVDAGRTPGEVFEIDIDHLPEKKIDDFSMHQMPTTNLLKELKDECGVDVRIIAVQVQRIPEEVSPGISGVLRNSMEEVTRRVFELVEGKHA